MKRVAVVLLIFSLILGCVNAQESQPIELSSSQKGVKTSSDVLLIAMPIATLTGVIIKQDWTGFKQAAFSAVTTIGITYLLKYTVKKERPDFSDNHSFPSAHTSIMFANAAFIQRRYGWTWGIPAFTLATYVGWARTYAKKHDWWDVLVGAAIGAGSSYIFTRPFAEKYELTLLPISDGENFGIYTSMKF